MDRFSGGVAGLLARVKRRWRQLVLLTAAARAALAVACVIAATLVVARVLGQSPRGLALWGVLALVVAGVLAVRALWILRQVPSDRRLARFIEEQDPSLDDRLVSAIELAGRPAETTASGLAPLLLADANRRAAQVDPALVVPGGRLRRAALLAAAASVALAGLAVLGRETLRQTADAVSYTLFPARLTLEVNPGDARVPAGSTLMITARLVGNRAPVAARLERTDGEGWSATEMTTDQAGGFRAEVGGVADAFRYRVVAGRLTSPTFDVAVMRPPRVTRVDVEYRYPSALGLPPRLEKDTGDIYAPAGTTVRVVVHTDQATRSGALALTHGGTIPLASIGPTEHEAVLSVARDDGYRVGVIDRDGLSSASDTEYFIRVLEDRPPEVRVIKPARDRSVTPLDEIDIQAEAQDDFGIDSLDFVYAVRGGAEKAVPMAAPRREPTVTGTHTLYLEDLSIAPGDFVSYYVRARDVARGRRSREARSDLFFLEVKPFDQEFSLAQSQAGGGGGNQSVEELINAQKEVIVATWKLDRRARAAQGARSAQDVRAVARAETELKTRVEGASSASRSSKLRDPRRRGSQPGTLRAGQTSPEEDAMTAAALAMGKAADALNALQTTAAMPSELEALNHLIKAQGEVKKHEVSRQAGVGAGGSNRSAPDLSTLFDKELQRHQQTNYETPTATERREDGDSSLRDRIRELAIRQDELFRRQQELTEKRAEMTAEEIRRALEALTREQSELRQRADEVARQMNRGSSSASQRERNPQNQNGSSGQPAQPSSSGQSASTSSPSQSGQARGQSSRPGDQRSAEEAGATGGDQNERLRRATDEMRAAVSELRREDPRQATARSARALEALRDLERQLSSGSMDEQRRAAGDLQLEARQLADAQRQIASEVGRTAPGADGGDVRRRLAAEEDRLAGRAERLAEKLSQQGAKQAPFGRAQADGKDVREALAEASRELERQRVTERMSQTARELRGAAEGRSGAREDRSGSQDRALRGTQEDIARGLERLADQLAHALGGRDKESQRLSDDLTRAQQLREQMQATSAEVERLTQGSGSRGNGQPASSSPEGGTHGGGQAGQRGERTGGASGAPGDGEELKRLSEQFQRQVREARELAERLGTLERRQRAGTGVTFADQGMVLSAPGTEAFKQDFAKWEELRRQTTQALERAESTIAQKLHARESRNRLGASVDDRPPPAYADQVDRYFRSLASGRPK